MTDDQGKSVTTGNYFTINALAPVITLHDLESDMNAPAGVRRFASFSSSEPLSLAYCTVDDWEEIPCLANTAYDLWFWPGTHTVTVRAFDKGGRSATVTKTFEIGSLPDAEQKDPPTTPVKPLASSRAKSELSLKFSTSVTNRRGTRKLIVRAQLSTSDLQPGVGCRGTVQFSAQQLVAAARNAELKMDAAGRCVASRTYRLKRSSRNKKINVTAEFLGNDIFMPSIRSGHKHL